MVSTELFISLGTGAALTILSVLEVTTWVN